MRRAEAGAALSVWWCVALCVGLCLSACPAPTAGEGEGEGAEGEGEGAEGEAPPPPPDADCVEAATWFREQAWPRVFSTCAACHGAGGEADGTRFLLVPETLPQWELHNMAALREAGRLAVPEGRLVLLKPTLQLPHGGGAVFAQGSAEEDIVEEALALVDDVVCAPTPDPPAGLVLFSDLETLHKASVQLVGRAPTDDEIALVRAEGLTGLNSVVAAQLREPAFAERVREIYGDVLLTDGFRANNTVDNTGNLLNASYYDGAGDRFGGEDYDWRSWPDGDGIKLVEALAREPLEFYVQAVANDRPMTDVVTARHRLLNAWSARFFGVPYKGHPPGTPFADIDAPDEFVAVEHVPGINEVAGEGGVVGEYAGVLTTTAFINRYPSSPTNFNRKRARFVLKHFFDFDIMKTAPRIDASTVDLNANPTRNNPQCTGCHTQIDPLAGMFMNQGGCSFDTGNYYRLPRGVNDCSDDGWVPEELMFAAGVNASTPLPRGERRRALEVLGAHLAAQPEFARAMVVPVFTSLLGRPRLLAPPNPTTPDEVALAAAQLAEDAELARLTAIYVDAGGRIAPVVAAVIASPYFRAKNADAGGDLVALAGHGGGALVPPERLDKKLRALLGVTWAAHGGAVAPNSGFQRLGRHDGTDDAYLLLREELKTLYGGIDGSFTGVKTKQRQTSTLTAAIAEHLALEVSCLATSRDFEKPDAARLLFPGVDRGGVDEAAVRAAVVRLHWHLLGAEVDDDDPDVDDAVALWRDVRADGLAAIQAGAEGADLARPCAPTVDLATGQSVPGEEADPTYTVRAWQAVVAVLLLDPRFVLER